jgi:hypothetical protein
VNVVTELNPTTVLVDLGTKLANAKQTSADNEAALLAISFAAALSRRRPLGVHWL